MICESLKKKNESPSWIDSIIDCQNIQQEFTYIISLSKISFKRFEIFSLLIENNYFIQKIL